jgi:CyaY protein
MMEEHRYNEMAAGIFRKILAAADEIDPEILDADSTGDKVELTAASGQKCIINTQRAVRQIWVAGKGQGIHFSYDEAGREWRDDKGKGLELFAFIAEVVQAISGAKLSYPA